MRCGGTEGTTGFCTRHCLPPHLSLSLYLLIRHDTNEWPLRWRSGDRDHRVIGTLLCGGLKWSTEGGSEETDSSPICSLLWSRSERAVVFCFIRRKRKRRKMDPFLRYHFVRNPGGAAAERNRLRAFPSPSLPPSFRLSP